MHKKQKKQIEKRIKGLEKQKEKHEQKLEKFKGEKDTTHDYWIKEIERIQREIDHLENKKAEST